MKFKNLTPHVLNVLDEEGNPVMEIPPSGEIARVSVSYRKIEEVNGIPIFSAHYGEIVNLPEPEPGTYFIVSGMVKSTIPNRLDVFSPGELVRDENGMPIGCKGLKF